MQNKNKLSGGKKPKLKKKHKDSSIPSLASSEYYSDTRVHISNSQLNVFAKSPALYKARFIDKTIPSPKVTPRMLLGSIVDEMVTRNNPKKPQKLYVPKIKGVEAEDGTVPVPFALYLQAEEIAAHIQTQPFWYEGQRTARFQEVLTGTVHNTPVCGKPDRIDKLRKRNKLPAFRIVDLKVSSPQKVTSPKKWLMSALDSGYLRQLALYQAMLASIEQVPKANIDCYNAVTVRHELGLVRSYLYKVPQYLLDHAYSEIENMIYQIENNQFDEPLLTYKDAREIDE